MPSQLNIGVSGRQSAEATGRIVLFFGIKRRICVAPARQLVVAFPSRRVFACAADA
jgi:hypothetical protein